MAEIETSIMINKPLPEVFNYISSMENMPEMMPNIIKIDKPGQGVLRAGDKVTETRMIRGREMKNTLEIVENEENTRFAYKSEINGLKSIYRYFFKDSGGGTIIEFKAEIETKGLMMNLTKKLIVNMIKKEDGNQLQYLKETLESPGQHT